MMVELQRVTTEYCEIEDRLRLSGEPADGGVVTVWLTRRLLDRVTAVLLEWLAQRGAADAQVAQPPGEAEAPQAPVPTAGEEATWLASSVDVTRGDEGVRLVFKRSDGTAASLVMNADALRQWLQIVYRAYRAGQWPSEHWPDWLRTGVDGGRGVQGARLH